LRPVRNSLRSDSLPGLISKVPLLNGCDAMGKDKKTKPKTLKPFVSHFVAWPPNELIKLKVDDEFHPLL
jgi:hypothetical protein